MFKSVHCIHSQLKYLGAYRQQNSTLVNTEPIKLGPIMVYVLRLLYER